MKKSDVGLWSLTAALAGFLFGFDTAVISGAEQDVQRVWSMDAVTHSLAISAALWGAVIGALLGGAPSDRYGRKATVGIGAVNLVFTIAGLLLIDRAGRRALMTIGSVGYIVSLSAVAFGFATQNYALVLWFILAFIASHAIGQGAVIWVCISEIFSNAARAKGQALGAGAHWVLAALLTLVMPYFLATAPPATIFACFAAMMVLQLVFVRLMMVETRGRALEEVAASLERRA